MRYNIAIVILGTLTREGDGKKRGSHSRQRMLVADKTGVVKEGMVKDLKAGEKSAKDAKPYEDFHIAGEDSAYDRFENLDAVAEKENVNVTQEEELFYCPAERYFAWDDLSYEVDEEYIVAAEMELHYTPTYWNEFSSPVEDMDWFSLYEDMQIGAGIMGYNEDRWDCCINHYGNYDWDELDMDGYPEIQMCYEVLGWDNVSWVEESKAPESENKTWAELTLFEQAAADYVCYDEALWNVVPLPWSNDTNFDSPPAEMNFTCPSVRYSSWSDLEPAQKYAALDLGYDEYSWNNYQDPIEELSWGDIVIEADWHQALIDLGYEEQQWDCCVNNYIGYSYWELDDEDVFPLLQTAVAILGWNEESWDSGNSSLYPDTENKFWAELTDLEKAAADYLCYYDESWDEDNSIYEQEEFLEEEEDAE